MKRNEYGLILSQIFLDYFIGSVSLVYRNFMLNAMISSLLFSSFRNWNRKQCYNSWIFSREFKNLLGYLFRGWEIKNLPFDICQNQTTFKECFLVDLMSHIIVIMRIKSSVYKVLYWSNHFTKFQAFFCWNRFTYQYLNWRIYWEIQMKCFQSTVLSILCL